MLTGTGLRWKIGVAVDGATKKKPSSKLLLDKEESSSPCCVRARLGLSDASDTNADVNGLRDRDRRGPGFLC